MIPLTEKQLELLTYLRTCERSPSFDEMRAALGLKSKSGVHRLVRSLEERGYIRLPDTLAAFSNMDLAREAGRRGLQLGHIHRDIDGTRKFHAVMA